ncbi:MAG: TlpA family protein disulfide reductase [Gammaproteobacteria bacterium]|nr:TlpA family protein disulfide reductase [Gammaproteobacteria bacterium]
MLKFIFSLFILLLNVSFAFASVEKTIALDDGSELYVSHYRAKGTKLVIWLAPEAGLQPSEQDAAQKLSERGVEVWYPDLFEANFLPVATSSMDKIPAEQISGLVNAASKTTKQVYVLTSGRGVIPALRGIRAWQIDNPGNDSLRGLILLSPKFFLETPDPGQAAEIMPIVNVTNLPIFIMQPNQSPWWWKLDKTIPALEKGGSDVFIRVFSGVRDRFNYRPDATSVEENLAKQLPTFIVQAMGLVSTQKPKREPVFLQQPLEKKTASAKKSRELKVFSGDPTPPPLILKNLFDQKRDLRDYKGKVVLINFWASWCPPCVHEMPSMQRLSEKLKDKPFEILAVNMAEDKQVIKQFVRDIIHVDFPILLDSDGEVLKNWGVFAFPTTYVIGKQGNIRYALFGSREWDEDDVLRILNTLIDE